MKNSASEAKIMWLETFQINYQIGYFAMDSTADDYVLFREFNRYRKIDLITWSRENMDKTLHRKKVIKFMKKPKH